MGVNSSVAIGTFSVDRVSVAVDKGVEVYDTAVCVPAAENVNSIIFSIGIDVSLAWVGEVDGFNVEIKMLHKQKRKNRLEHPTATFPLSFCFENHEGNC